METHLYFLGVLVLMGTISFITFKLIFKKSLTVKIGINMLILGETLAFASFIIAKDGFIQLIWLGPLGLIVFIGLLKYIFNQINRLSVLANQALAISEGNFINNLDTNNFTREDEIGILANAINSMLVNLQQSVNIANSIANGNLLVDTKELSDKNELDSALKKMLLNLKNVIEQITISSDRFVVSSEEISASAEQIASGSNEQASSTEEVSASMEEMTANVNQNTENALVAEKISVKAAESIIEGNESFKVTLNAMKEIAKKITIIGDIAEKTDILAINAAIEAARAGEQGKGFAVVATEIRKLAENSQTAAQEIDELVGKSVTISEESGTLLSEITPEIQKTSVLVQEIANAGNEQNSGANQINDAIQELTKVITQNSSAADQMAVSSKNMSLQAVQLKETVAFFQTAETKLTAKNIVVKNKQEENENKISEIKVPNNTEKEGFNLNLKESGGDDDEFESY